MKLKLNCEVDYYSNFLETSEANELFKELTSLVEDSTFRPQIESGDSVPVNFGKIMFLDQNLLDENKFPEQQWGPTMLWTKKMESVKNQIETLTNQQFQVCVLIHYPDGNSGVDFHSDFVAFGDTSVIPSISLGEERTFIFREIESGIELETTLENGSLVIMGEHCQQRYEHSLPTNPKYKNPRINLTFRKYGFSD